MGFLDDILSPIKSAINTLEEPVKEVVKLFGEAAQFIEDLINTIKNVITQIENLFNESKIEYMFLHPFKEAALTAIGDLERLTSIALSAGGDAKNMVDDIMIDIETPIIAVTQKLKDSFVDFETITATLIKNIKDEVDNISYGIFTEFDSLKADIEALPSYLDDFGRSIENMFEVRVKRAYKVGIEFDNAVERKVVSTTRDLRSDGEMIYKSLDSFKHSVETRLNAESKSLDLAILVVVALILGSIIGVYLLTKSISATLIVIVMLVVIILISLLVELVK